MTRLTSEEIEALAQNDLQPCSKFPLAFLTDPWFKQLTAMNAAQQARLEKLRRIRATADLLTFTELNTPSYLPGWVHKEVCAALDAFVECIEQKTRPRLMITFPPRHGKSAITSICLPAYILGRHPEWEVVLATASQDLSNDFGRVIRSIVTSPMYQDMFPNTTLEGSSIAVDNIVTSKRGSFRAVGVGGQLVGRGATVLIIDDAIKDAEAAASKTQLDAIYTWFQAVARTRMAPGGGIIIMNQRWSEEDLCGRIIDLEQLDPLADRFTKFNYPAIATEDEPHRKKGEALHPERYPLPELEAIKRSLTPRQWSAMYQQNPVPQDGILFREEWLKRTVKREALPEVLNYYLTTDLAVSQEDHAAYTVLRPFAVDAKENLYYLPPIRKRLSPFEIVEEIIKLALTYEFQHLILEKTHVTQTIGPFLRQRLREESIFIPIWEGVPTRNKDKVARTTSLRGRMEQGKVFFVDDSIHNDIVFPEYLSFPAGKFKDIVDADSWGCIFLDELDVPPPAEDAVPDEAPRDTMEWMQSRVRRRRGDSSKHVPLRLTGHSRHEEPDFSDGWGETASQNTGTSDEDDDATT